MAEDKKQEPDLFNGKSMRRLEGQIEALDTSIKSLGAKLEGFESAHKEMLARTSEVNDKVDALSAVIEAVRGDSDEPDAENEAWLKGIISDGVAVALAQLQEDGSLHQDLSDVFEQMKDRLIDEVELKNQALLDKEDEIREQTQAILVKAENMKIGAWWSMIPFAVMCLLVFLTGASIYWLSEGVLQAKLQQIAAVILG